MKKLALFAILTCFALSFCVSPALAHPIVVYSEDDGHQDPLFLEGPVHECGDWFPVGEELVSSWVYTEITACSQAPYDDPLIPNALVTITNISCPVSELWYVADPETTLTNYDGFIGNAGLNDAQLAFKIDWLGVNQALISESMIVDNLFQVGETWKFIIQDFQNAAGGPPAPFDSLGIASLSAGWPPSTGSIVTPEPATMTILVLGGIALIARRRRR